MKTSRLRLVEEHGRALAACRRCPGMQGPVVTCGPVISKALLIGQAPGPKEGAAGRPFAWTAGKTLFRWFESIGIPEDRFRNSVYMAAVCRCFPGKNPKGGDRVPDEREIANCKGWLEREFEILEPELIIPVGKLAISQIMPISSLSEVVGRKFELDIFGHRTRVIPLPHPSGASTWHRMEPGKTLLNKALKLLAKEPLLRLEGKSPRQCLTA